MADSYYARRSARDPGWREREIARVREAERRRREADPDGFRACRCEANRRYRERVAATGLTFQQLLEHSLVRDVATLQAVLRDELRRGRVTYNTTTRRYSLNGGLPEDVKLALRDL